MARFPAVSGCLSQEKREARLDFQRLEKALMAEEVCLGAGFLTVYCNVYCFWMTSASCVQNCSTVASCVIMTVQIVSQWKQANGLATIRALSFLSIALAAAGQIQTLTSPGCKGLSFSKEIVENLRGKWV